MGVDVRCGERSTHVACKKRMTTAVAAGLPARIAFDLAATEEARKPMTAKLRCGVYIEYDTPGSGRGPGHKARILANDPDASPSDVILKIIP